MTLLHRNSVGTGGCEKFQTGSRIIAISVKQAQSARMTQYSHWPRKGSKRSHFLTTR